MAANTLADSLANQLFGNGELTLYAILDGAADPELRQQLWQHQVAHLCLLPGEPEPEMAQVAPYLARLEPETTFTDYVLEGWGRHRGIFLLSGASGRELRRHFRNFIVVHHPTDGRPLYFRFYDPRVLRVYLPSCNASEASALFGPVARYLVESDDGTTLLRFRCEPAGVQCERIALSH